MHIISPPAAVGKSFRSKKKMEHYGGEDVVVGRQNKQKHNCSLHLFPPILKESTTLKDQLQRRKNLSCRAAWRRNASGASSCHTSGHTSCRSSATSCRSTPPIQCCSLCGCCCSTKRAWRSMSIPRSIEEEEEEEEQEVDREGRKGRHGNRKKGRDDGRTETRVSLLTALHSTTDEF